MPDDVVLDKYKNGGGDESRFYVCGSDNVQDAEASATEQLGCYALWHGSVGDGGSRI